MTRPARAYGSPRGCSPASRTTLERYGERIFHGQAEFRAEGLIRLAGWSYELSSDEATRLRSALAKAGERDRKRFLKEARAKGIGQDDDR